MSAAEFENAVAAESLGRRYGRFWALQDCTFALPPGSITAVVGPNGAGKTTLLNMLVGLLPASTGRLEVCGRSVSSKPEFLAQVGYLAQNCPLYRDFTVAELMHFGRAMNPGWDDAAARDRLEQADVPLNRRASKLSGGQHAQVGLALAVAKRPRLLVLDEPLAALDPLARREFLKSLMASVAATGTTVVLSSHLIGELERVCDHLIVVRGGRVRLAGELDAIRDEHRWVDAPRERTMQLPPSVRVINRSQQGRHARLLVRAPGPVLDPELIVSPVGVEDLVLAYLDTPDLMVAESSRLVGHRG
jgi:ABC-2 type transport system ATP-binding protein